VGVVGVEGGQRANGAILAARAVLRKPFAKDAWRVLACALRGY
jgi:hypothetical protein